MILRIYADADGESHFQDVEFAFEQTDFVPPAPPVLMTPFEDAIGYGFERVHAGWHGDWHPVPQRLLAVYLSGAGTIEASDGEVSDLEPGTMLLADQLVAPAAQGTLVNTGAGEDAGRVGALANRAIDLEQYAAAIPDEVGESVGRSVRSFWKD